MRTAIGLIVGIVAGFLTVYLLEMIGHAIYPPPPGIDMTDMDALRDVMATMPAGALGLVLLAWVLATLIGGTLAGWIARTRQTLLAGVVGALILAGAIANMVLLPHPVWFSIAAVVLIPLAAWIAGLLGRRLSLPRAE